MYTHKNFQRMNKNFSKNRTKSSLILMKFVVEVDHIVRRLWLKFFNKTPIILADIAIFAKKIVYGFKNEVNDDET